MSERTRSINAARFILRHSGYGRLKFSLQTTGSWEKMLSHPELKDVEIFLRLHYRQWLSAVAIIGELEGYLKEALKPFKRELELLTSVPGVGLITASAMIAAVANPGRFASASRVASYIGIVPSTWDSASRQIRGHITKAGPSYIRGVLCEGAQQARLRTHPLHPYWRRICARGGYRKAIVAVAHRLVRIMFAIWRDGKEFDVTKLGVEPDGSQGQSDKVVYRLR
jgi:hypothetical protein